MASDTRRAIEAVWRIESAQLIAGLARIVRDVGIAEDLAQDALVAALERWPETGVPEKPGAWLMAAAKHRAIDHLRRNRRHERKHEELGRELDERQERAEPDTDAALDDAGGAGGARPRGADGAFRFALRSACGDGWSARAAARSGPRAVGSAPDPARARGAGARGGAERGARAVRAPGRNCRLPRAGAHRG